MIFRSVCSCYSRKDVDTIEFLYNLIGTPLGWILYFFYEFVCSNVGVAILLFTLVVKLAMLPLAIKQQKNTAKSAIFAPKVREIQQKYAKNQQKQQEELAKLQEQGYNPMGGCGSLLLSFLILFGVIDVVYKPMTHILHVPSQNIQAIIEDSYNVNIAAAITAQVNADTAGMNEDELKAHDGVVLDAKRILEYYNANCISEGEAAKEMSVWSEVTVESKRIVKAVFRDAMLKEYNADNKRALIGDTDLYRMTDEENVEMNAIEDEAKRKEYAANHSFSDKMREILNTAQTHFGYYRVTATDKVEFQQTGSLQRELYAFECFGTDNNKAAYTEVGTYSDDFIELYENLNFLGIPLGQVPWDNLGFPLVLIPIFAFLMAVLQTIISNRQMAQNNPEAAQMGGSMKIMMYIMPVFSLIFSFTVPAGAGFYWGISYVFGIAQSIVLNKLYSPEKLRAQAESELKERSKRIEVEARRVRDTDKDDTIVEVDGEKLTQKEINRRKLAAARKADALKYGEEYHEEDDD